MIRFAYHNKYLLNLARFEGKSAYILLSSPAHKKKKWNKLTEESMMH